FNSTHGARKGLADTALKTANSGYLTRRLVDVAQDCIVNSVDCGTDKGLTMTAIIDAGQVVASIGARVLGRTALDDIDHPVTGERIVDAGQMILEPHVVEIEKAGIQSIRIRSALTCEVQTGVCSICYGRDLARGTPVNMGEAVGVIAAQSIGEPGTQLTMRTFHLGGTATVVDQSFLEASYEGTVQVKNRNMLRNSDGVLVAMGRNMSVALLDERGIERSSQRVAYGSKLFVDDGDKVKRGQRLAEWDPYTRPMMTEVEGIAQFEDVVDSVSVTESTDESTGITKRQVIDWRSTPRGNDLKPAIVIKDASGNVLKLARGGEARFMLSVDAILSIEPGQKVSQGDVLARVPLESAKTKDITGGLPRVAELFEARRPKDHAIIAEIDGTIRLGRDYKNKRRVMIEPAEDGVEPVEYLIPKGKPFHLQEGDYIEKGDYILDGNPAPHDILAIKGVEALASYLVNEIQEVYRLQGVVINDKHIEVIVRQMLQKVEVTDAGDSQYIVGDNVDRIELDDLNEVLVAEGKRPAAGDPVLLGITKASLQTPSFISAASFQETTKVLTEAAIAGKTDTLQGLKENVIVGRLIPAGTGGTMTQIRRIATSRDEMILEERRKSSGASAATPMLQELSGENTPAE
ncbi:MAG: DNA-directed RNA polymerase subunit beta', partial [Pseudomonadota bacterium]|nr:DNA-directed RNA polymerase subunit beta' [Pseudomonadota bacterium]